VLQCETGRLSGGDRHWFKRRRAGEKRAATGGIIIIIIIIIIITMSNIPGNHEVKKLEKTAILDTVHILRKVLT
jgi:hypothetical protein